MHAGEAKSGSDQRTHGGKFPAASVKKMCIRDSPRAVKFKPRRVRQPDYVPAGIRLGRSYDDFLDYCSCLLYTSRCV